MAGHKPAFTTVDPVPASMSRLSVLRPFAWILLPLACHLGFSWIGFNPTDDGWMQAVARRIAGGEVPHRDFIFVRPALSALLQVPLVWWGGDHVIWFSRLWGWLTLAAVCWIWSGRVVDGPAGSPLVRLALYATALLLCAHTFPVMAWHSIDAMLFCTLAVALAARGTPWALRSAFFCAGLAALCRQNFAVFPPLLLLATGGRWREWFVAGFCAALPALLYVAGLALAGGLRDFFEQALATGGAFKAVGVTRFVKDAHFLTGIAAGVLAALALGNPRLNAQAWSRWLAPLLLLGAGGWLAVELWRQPGAFHAASFALFGFTLGLAGPVLWHGGDKAGRLTLVAGLGLAWTTAISIGYNSPALLSGVLLLLLWRLLHRLTPAATTMRPVLLVVLIGTAAAFSHARQTFPYRDRSVDQLRWDAGEVLPGAAGLRTNVLTQATLADLRRLTMQLEREGKPYAILTDFAAHWIRSPQRNPLSCEWPQETELGYSPALFRRLFGDLRRLPPDARILVQKYLVSDYEWRMAPVPGDWSYYFVQNWVRTNCPKAGETEFFEVFGPPPPAP